MSNSDETLLAVVAHEVNEIEGYRLAFANAGGTGTGLLVPPFFVTSAIPLLRRWAEARCRSETDRSR